MTNLNILSFQITSGMGKAGFSLAIFFVQSDFRAAIGDADQEKTAGKIGDGKTALILLQTS